MYKDGLPTTLDSANGQGWLNRSQPYISQPEAGKIAVVFGPSEAYWFAQDGDNYSPLHGSNASLSFDSSNCHYVFNNRSASVSTFTNKGVADGGVSPGGQLQQTRYTSDGQIAEIFQQYEQGGQTVTNSNVYEYISSGPNVGKLQSLTVKRSINPTTEIRRMVYSYYEADEEFGSLGDLKTGVEQILRGVTWVDHETSYYRYYKEGDANGFAHGLRYVLGPQAFARLKQDPQVADPFLATNSKIAEYADKYFEYDAQQRATKSVIQAGLLSYTYAYTVSAHSDSVSNWKQKVTVTRPDGSQQSTYTNYLQSTLLVDFSFGGDHWIDYYEYDADSREILHAHPSAVIGYDEGDANLAVILRADEGLIDLTNYYATTTATPTTPGGVSGKVQFTKIQKGTSGAEIKLSETTYFERSAGNATFYPIAELTRFRHTDGTGEITTSFAYTWFDGTTQVEQRTTMLPIVPVNQNGTGLAEIITEIYNDYGHLIWVRDARGFITYRAYDLALGVMTQEIQDVDGAKVTLPNGWSTPVGGGLNLVTDYEYDSLGRMTQSLGPMHEMQGQSTRTARWAAYRDLEDETYSAIGYAVGTPGDYVYTLVNPVQISRTSDDGLTADSITAVRGAFEAMDCTCDLEGAGVVESPGRLSVSDQFPQSSWVAWSSTFANRQGQLVANRTYHAIPECGEGAIHANYDESTYGYDEMNRQNRVTSASGTISRTVFGVRNQATSQWIGTNDAMATTTDPSGGGATGNNMVQASASQYDDGEAGGDGYLTQSTAFVDASTVRETAYQYDFRGRQVAIDGEIDFYQEIIYDNLGNVIQIDRRDTNSEGNLIARSETKYDNRGRVYQAIRYGVNPDTGTVGNSLVDNTYYDASGNVTESRPAGSQSFTKSVYDGIGRQIAEYVGYSESSSSSSSFTGGSVVSGDVVFEQMMTTYDAASKVIFTTACQRYHDATGTGPLNGPSGSQPKSRDSYIAMWYDGIGRQNAVANYGTNDNAGPPERPVAPPSSSETILVTFTNYNQKGEAFEAIDAAGMISRTYSDAAGRTVRTIANFISPMDCDCPGSDQNATTLMQYGAGGKLAQLVAVNRDTGDQVTQYLYGVTLASSDLASNDLLAAEIYPDAKSSADRVTYAYNRQGQRASMVDQNGSVHEYDYDLLGRSIADRVPVLAIGVDGAVRRIETTYDVRGLVEKATSYDAATSGNVVNQAQNAYNSFEQLMVQYQAHDGAVDTGTTPKVQYGYADGSANTVRPTSMTYPNGTQLEYRYDDPDANNLSRIRTLHWDGSDVCSYNYLGLKTFVTTDYLQPQVQLDYALGSGANPYAGFDRFGRIIDLLWAKYGVDSSSSSSNGGQGNSVVHLKYGYDRESNRTHREDLVAQAYGKNFDELYEYDGLHRLKKFHRGRLTVDNQTITSPTLQQGWVLDATGNWQNFTQNDQADANRTLDQQRLANRVNEITQIARTVGQQWATPEYDKNGNMTTIPQLEEPTATYKGTWDAWNRLVKLEEPNGDGGWQNLMQYQYDGQAWRIISLKHSGGIAEETKHVYFTSQWQEIEVRVGTTPIDAPASQQFVWGERYIDDLLLRDRDSTSEGFLNERLYVTQDANWNVVAISNTEGSILARIAYSPYGVDSDLNSAFEECDAETLSWTRRYHGYSQCQVTFLFNVRMRSYHPCLGIWISRDPDGYGLDANLYLFDRANPLAYIDFTGKKPLSDKEKEELKGCLCRVNEGAPQDGLAWVECDGKGGLRVKYLPKDDIPSPVDQGCFKTCGAYNCTGSHERVHIEQIKHVNPDVCKGKIAGGHIQVSSDCTSIFECRAHVVDQDCLLNIFDKLSKKDKPCTLPDGSRRSCKSYIQNSITERKQKVEQKYKCKDKAINLPGLP
ncbi:hypothetical protein C5Y93_21770 [Blastopirellula marina]|uniref:Uncharacterized protein n=2 Tax=Blastopirellula marina TaxID=124 RepID=A0A2S8GH82_9BACT|nr:hypothetical protein C5Y93_21770 [Blastopirellula marina]